jgi:hypothetical protein
MRRGRVENQPVSVAAARAVLLDPPRYRAERTRTFEVR